jgi:hypothetical protein
LKELIFEEENKEFVEFLELKVNEDSLGILED